MSSADLVTCLCIACSNLLCVSTNDWTEVTTSYATYDVVAMFSHPGMEQTGPQRPGSRESELGGCTVQPLHCTKCKEAVGVKCTSVAPEKEMHRDRCFLKLGKLTMRSLTGTEVEAKIKTRGAPQSDVNASAAVEKSTNHVSNAKSIYDANVSNHHSPSVEIRNEGQVPDDTKQILQRQEGDIIVILQTLETLQKEMKSFQKEFKSVKAAINDVRTKQEDQQVHELSEDIELLTETVANVSGKVGELDGLKLESKMMQSRIKRLEDEKRGLQIGTEPLAPSVPKLAANSARSGQTPQPTGRKAVGNNTNSPRGNASSPATNSVPNRSRAASVLHNDVSRTNLRNEMPPPEIPRSMSSRASAKPPSFYSATGTGHNPLGRSKLHNAISILNDDASDNLPATQEDEDDDDEYNDQESSPDPDDKIYHPPRRSRQSLPARMASVDKTLEGRYDPKSNKRRRTTSHALDRENNTPPSPHPDDPNYESIWAAPRAESDRGTPAPALRNEHGLIIKPNGEIDKRSLRFLGKKKRKRRSVKKDAPRDTDGYLLDANGKRNPRSVRIINGMRKRDEEEMEEDGESVESGEELDGEE